MPYNHTTFAQAKQSLANELGDSGKVFFTDHELGRYIIEALRWWGLTAQYFRETGQIETIAGQSFYRIETDLFNGAGTSLLQSLTVTDRDLINDINYAVMEPQISVWASGWAGTEMFSLEEIVGHTTECRDEFLKLTACIAEGYTLPAAKRVNLPSDHIRILRAEIDEVASDGPLPLWVDDQVQIYTTFKSAAQPEPARPKSYAVSYTPQLTVDLWPEPIAVADLGIQGIRTGGTLDPTVAPTVIKIPDDASVVLKYRIISDLLAGDGLVRCPQIADYCEQRYQEGLETMARYLSLLWSNDGGARSQISTISQWDQVRPTWRYATPGEPTSVAMLNWNTVGVRPVPDGAYVMTFEVIRKAPVPTVDGDFIQVGREHMRAIYDYASHVALVKSQGVEFDITMQKYQSAVTAASEYRAQIGAQSYLYQASQLPSLQEKWFRPLRKVTGVAASQNDRQLVEV